MEAAVRVRNYPSLLKQVAHLKSQNQELERTVSEAPSEATASWSRGVREGRQQVRGYALSQNIIPPVLLEVVCINGVVGFMAQAINGNIAEIGARFLVVAETSQDIKGAVDVRRYDEDRAVTYLQCVEISSERFWRHLVDQVEVNPAPPPQIVLQPYPLPPLEPSDDPPVKTSDRKGLQ